jgi:hypothetical protein
MIAKVKVFGIFYFFLNEFWNLFVIIMHVIINSFQLILEGLYYFKMQQIMLLPILPLIKLSNYQFYKFSLLRIILSHFISFVQILINI